MKYPKNIKPTCSILNALIIGHLKTTGFVYLTIACFSFLSPLYGQETTEEEAYKENVFLATQLVNVQTTETLPKGSFEFKIQHRFGIVGSDESLYQNFLGLDLPANIRLALLFPFSDRWYIGVGRTKVDKTIDFESKLLLLKQAKNQGSPISLAVYGNLMIRTDPFPDEPSNSFFSDSTTVFEYKFNHKLSYQAQVIISRKFGNRLSMQVSPVFIYENLVEPGRDNYTGAIPITGRFRFGLLNSSIIFEYAPVLNNHSDDFLNPVSIGAEFGTAGHVFQIMFSSSNYILEKNLYTRPSADYTDGKFTLGFNIKRTFWSKKQ
jgi:hypothetical protein